MGPKRKYDSSSWTILFISTSLILISSNTNLVSCSDQINYFQIEKDRFPCSYFESINITAGVKNSDNSITFNGITYPKQHYAMYGYAYKSRHERIKVPKHIRGCVCIFKKCIRLCCENQMYFHEYKVTDKCEFAESFDNLELSIVHNNGDVITYNMFDDNPIAVVHGQPCGGYFLRPEMYPDDAWIILEDGRLYQNDSGQHHEVDSYCIASVYHNETMDNMLRAFICAELSHPKISAGYQVGMLISIPFLLATLLVYAWIRELRATLHGKSLMCYIGCLTIALTFLTIIQLNGSTNIDTIACQIMALSLQGSFLAAFFWLNVISFDIWWTIGKPGDHHGNRFLYYSLYAFGASFSILVINVIIDNIDSIPWEYQPGFATDSCWLRHNKLVQFIYFHLFILTIITFNTIFFGLTANNIRIVQQQSAKALSRGDSRKHAKIQSEKDKFGLYLRLFIIMGVTWSMEVLSWWFHESTWILYIMDTCNLMQGPLIFLLFVWKPRVRALIRERYSVWRGLKTETNVMGRTSTSHISMERTTMIVKQEDNGKSNYN